MTAERADEPGIVVEPGAAWCAEHLEPFRAAWPAGYLPAVMALTFQALNHDEEIIRASGGRVEALTAVLREFGPLCCRLDPSVLDEITTGALAGGDEMIAMLGKHGPPPPEKRGAPA